jgi:hypothetical protein
VIITKTVRYEDRYKDFKRIGRFLVTTWYFLFIPVYRTEVQETFMQRV